MPLSDSFIPRYILPPPITIATCTPRSVTVLMSFAYCSIISGEKGSKPLGLLPKKDSPDNFKRMRLYFGSMYTILFGLQIERIFAQVPSGQDKNLNKYNFSSIT